MGVAEKGKLASFSLYSFIAFFLEDSRKHQAPAEDAPQDGGLQGGFNKHSKLHLSSTLSAPAAEGNEEGASDATHSMITFQAV